jgi:hypothetical protein|tara:strand:+ start:2982 stop:3161 length:180 start_codon:yes stop_codon:yes gene_type:complete
MSIGDLVRIRKNNEYFKSKVGIILDFVEENSGFLMYEILVNGHPEWFSDIDVETLSESR